MHPVVQGAALARALVALAEVVGHGGDTEEPDDAVELADAVLERRTGEAPTVYGGERVSRLGGRRGAGLRGERGDAR